LRARQQAAQAPSKQIIEVEERREGEREGEGATTPVAGRRMMIGDDEATPPPPSGRG